MYSLPPIFAEKNDTMAKFYTSIYNYIVIYVIYSYALIYNYALNVTFAANIWRKKRHYGKLLHLHL